MESVEKLGNLTATRKKSAPKASFALGDQSAYYVVNAQDPPSKSEKFGASASARAPKVAPSIFAVVKRNLSDQVMIVRKGLPSMVVMEMSDVLKMPRSNLLDSLQLPRSTIEARIKKKSPLTSAEGDAVLRMAKAYSRAEEVFGDSATASAWLKRQIRSLGGVTPVSLLDTESGFELVLQTLGRIEHGVVA